MENEINPMQVKITDYAFVATITAVLLLTGCDKYKSSIESEIACQQWAKQGGSYSLKKEYIYIESVDYIAEPVRSCKQDTETKKWIGFSKANIKAGSVVTEEMIFKAQDIVEKRFSY